jgi:hypothetical protein
MDYIDFKNGPAAGIFAALGEDWADVLGRSESFDDLRRSVVDLNGRDHGRFVNAARGYATTCSSGELVQACAGFEWPDIKPHHRNDRVHVTV